MSRRARVLRGDVREVLARMPDNTFDAVLCDPPYGLAFMGKRWDYDVPSAALWREVLRVCKPGAPLIAFSGTRTYHRTAVQIEDAGWEIRDCLAWMYGSGFPKSLDVSKAIDKRRDDTADVRVVCRFLRAAMERARKSSRWIGERFNMHSRMVDHWAARDTDSQPNLPTWEQWLALKDLLEFGDEMDAEVWRLNGRKGEPDESWKEAEVIGEHEGQTPGFVGHCFTKVDSKIRAANTDTAREWSGYGTALKPAFEPAVLARKPLEGTVAQNVVKWGVGALAIDASRIGTTGATKRGSQAAYPKNDDGSEDRSGSWARTGHEVVEIEGMGRWPANVLLDETAAAMLDAQAPRTGGNGKASGPTKTGASESVARNVFKGWEGEPCFYGDSGGASRFFYCAKASRSERGEGNTHPTVKPLALCEYLARLVLPPKAGRILVPFSGSGSEMIGALRAGWPDVLGIEREADYAAIAEARLARAFPSLDFIPMRSQRRRRSA